MNEKTGMVAKIDQQSSSPGKVYLVGAGPGDPGLITVKGLAVLRQADVIVYDYLVNPALLQEAKSSAMKIYAGKAAGQHILSQKEINMLLVEHAQNGKTVVRLKGGDPFVFGRGGEEAEILAGFGICWEVIPGVSSAIAVPAYAGIPVTHREWAAAFTVVTGHKDPTKDKTSFDWEALAHINGTLIFLMGIGNLSSIAQQLMHYGCAESTPVAVIRWGSMPIQETVIGTLGTIADQVQQAHLQSPAVIVVGEVVNLRQRLQWFEASIGSDDQAQ
jgi:uroporphyrinogen III methyltransferase / synthase